MPERFGPWSTVYQRFRDWRTSLSRAQLSIPSAFIDHIFQA
jgi:hypothetical protein